MLSFLFLNIDIFVNAYVNGSSVTYKRSHSSVAVFLIGSKTVYRILTAMLVLLSLTACSSMDEQELYHRINEAYDFEVTHCDSFAMVAVIYKCLR